MPVTLDTSQNPAILPLKPWLSHWQSDLATNLIDVDWEYECGYYEGGVNRENSETKYQPGSSELRDEWESDSESLNELSGNIGYFAGWMHIGSVLRFFFFHLHTFSSCWTVTSPLPHFIVSIDCAVCFIIMLFTYTCLLFVSRCMYFIHATYMFTFYLFITCHASMAHSYINCL